MPHANYRWMILDLSTAPMHGAGAFIDPPEDRKAPDNYKDPQKIADWQRAAFERDVRMCGADLDLAQITGAAFWTLETGLKIGVTYGDEMAEQKILGTLARVLREQQPAIITYNGLTFDLPMLVRRCAYLGVDLPYINMDRYRTDHVDVYERLTLHGKVRARSLEWYVRRLGFDLVKPLSGEEEARVIEVANRPPGDDEDGADRGGLGAQDPIWKALKESLRHDVLAIARVATAFGIGEFPAEPGVPEPTTPMPV